MSNKVNGLKLYRGGPYPITDKLVLTQPTIEDLEDNEDLFWVVLYTFIGNTTMRRLWLWNHDMDWNRMSNYELFCRSIVGMPPEATSMFFKDVDFQTFDVYEIEGFVPKKIEDIKLKQGQKKPTHTQKRNLRFDNWNYSHTLYSQKMDMEINSKTYEYMADVMRQMVHIYPKNEYTVGKASKQVIIQEEKDKMEKQIKDSNGSLSESNLQPMISMAVNMPGYPYNIEETYHLTINQFMDCVSRLQIIQNTTALLRSTYIGLIDSSKIPKENLDFMRSINRRG